MAKDAGGRTIRETEAKFRVNPSFQLPVVVGVVPAVVSADTATHISMIAVYYDTPDLRLAREGVTLRRRSGGADAGWHLKLPVLTHSAPDGAGVRDEMQLPDSAEIPTELRALVTVWVRTATLGPVATLASERTTQILRGADGRALAELVDDTVSVEGGHNQEQFRELEVEDTSGDESIVAKVATVLRDAGAVGGEFVPKVVRALGPQATTPPDPPAPMPVAAHDPVSDVVAATLRQYTRLLMTYDLAVRRGIDDAVHQMRVATRRLRSVLRSFEPFLEPEWADALASELQWLGAILGTARDAEVLRDRLAYAVTTLPAEAKPAAVGAKLSDICNKQHRLGYEQVETTLASDRYVALMERLVDAATLPRTTDSARRPASVVLIFAIKTSWSRMRRKAAPVTRRRGATTSATDYHQVRIAAKHVRYLCDAAAPALGPKARKLSAQAARIQDILGEHHDAVVAGEFIAEVAALPRIGASGFGLGLLFAREQECARAATRQFAEIWPDVIRAKRRRFLAR